MHASINLTCFLKVASQRAQHSSDKQELKNIICSVRTLRLHYKHWCRNVHYMSCPRKRSTQQLRHYQPTDLLQYQFLRLKRSYAALPDNLLRRPHCYRLLCLPVSPRLERVRLRLIPQTLFDSIHTFQSPTCPQPKPTCTGGPVPANALTIHGVNARPHNVVRVDVRQHKSDHTRIQEHRNQQPTAMGTTRRGTFIVLNI